MATKNTGGPAFPVPGLQADEDFNGMSLRDYFAAKAMAAMLAEPNLQATRDEFAKYAYEMADAMLAARSA